MPASRLRSDNLIGKMLRTWLVALAVFGMFFPSAAALAEGVVSLVLSGRSAAYQDVAEAFQEAFGGRQPVRVLYVDMMSGDELDTLIRSSGLVVPVGLGAVRQVAANHAVSTPVLSLLVPRSGYEDVSWSGGAGKRRLSAIYIDQPVSRSFALINSVLPLARRVGVMLPEDGPATLADMQKEAARYALKMEGRQVGAPGEIAPALRTILPEADVLLLQPDAMIINANNVQNVLLTTYRYRVPVIGFSEGLVKAGAVAAVFSTAVQVGRQGGLLAAQWARTGDLPSPMYCKEFSVAFNQHVARSLGLSLPDAAGMAGRLGSAP